MKCLGGHMECLGGTRLQIFLTLFTHATPGTPASLTAEIWRIDVKSSDDECGLGGVGLRRHLR